MLIGVLRALVEVALLFLLGRGLLAVLAGGRRNGNLVYRFFVLVTQPVLSLLRRLVPPQILDRHLPVVAFFVLFWLWIGLAWLRVVLLAAPTA